MSQVQWRSLITIGVAFWTVFYLADFLGDPSWKRYSSHLDDILGGQQLEIEKMRAEMLRTQDEKNKLNWPLLVWNLFAILFSLAFFSAVRSLSWVIWKMYVVSSYGFRNRSLIWNFFKSKKVATKPTVSTSEVGPTKISKSSGCSSIKNCNETTSVSNDFDLDANYNTKVIFKSRSFCQNQQQTIQQNVSTNSNNVNKNIPIESTNSATNKWQDNILMVQEHATLCKQLEDTKKENNDLSRELILIKKENQEIKQQVEECKLETTLLQEKLAKTENVLKNSISFKDFAYANQEVMARKTTNLELHLQEVSRDRDLLRNKLSSLEKSHCRLEERLRSYEMMIRKHCSSNGSNVSGAGAASGVPTTLEELPEKDEDVSQSQPTSENQEVADSEANDDDNFFSQFQKKLMEIQGYSKRGCTRFDSNSKLSLDFDESGADTSRDPDRESQSSKPNSPRTGPDLVAVKQNLLNYDAYRKGIFRPKAKLDDIEEGTFIPTEDATPGSSSDEQSTSAPRRIISSTMEFQKILTSLKSSSSSSFNKKFKM